MDLTQNVFIVVHRQLAGFEGRSQLTTWLCAICRLVAKDYLRSARIRHEVVLDAREIAESIGAGDGALKEVDSEDVSYLLKFLLSRMPKKLRVVFVMFELDELSGDEIARLLNLPVGTVRSRLRLARQVLQRNLQLLSASGSRRTAHALALAMAGVVGCSGGGSVTANDAEGGGSGAVGASGSLGAGSGGSGTAAPTGSGGGSATDASARQDDGAAHDATSAPGDVAATPELDAAETNTAADARPPPAEAAGSNKVLIYGVTSPGSYRHASISTAADAIAKAAAAVGLSTESVGTTDATNTVDPTKFTAASLAQYGAVILLANDGEPFGYPAIQEIQNLADYVQQGGALAALECASDCYGGAFSAPIYNHPPSLPYHALLGATFAGHSNFAPATCTTMGSHPSVAQLAGTFHVTDEIYAFNGLAADNQVVMTCVSSTDPQTVRPIAWYRTIGAGRYFYSALGHPPESWTKPMDPNVPNSRLVEDHFLPGLLWTMKR
jgi:RNA polymerase sigma-70 factor (ECF subfamily)